MSNRWFVYRENETLGPFYAHEVRAGLRSGDLDPFDKVGLEGSSIQRALLDIDEIFLAENEQAAVSGSDIVTKSFQEADLTSPLKAKAGAGYLGGAIEKIKDGNKEAVSEFVKKYKSYFVLSQNNIWGPYSYQQIVELYKKGTLPKEAKIKKNGYSKSIPIRAFVKKHSTKKKRSNSHSANIIALQNNKRRFIIVKSENKSLQWLSIAVVFVSIIIALAMLSQTTKNNQTAPAVQKRTAPAQTAQVQAPPAIKKTTARKTTARKTSRVKSKPKIQRRASKPATRKTTVRKAPAKKTYKRTKTPTKVRRRVASRPTIKRRAPIRKKVSGPSLSSLPSLGGREGDEVTIGPLAFSTGKLQGCSNKCTLNFADRNAKTIRVVFFKGAYLGKLLSKKGAAILQGTVSDNGNTLILQNVR